jgi:hypothetical protein
MISNLGARQRQDAANLQNTQFWNMQNKYNTPQSQMARLKEAGLNPALIYGSGATNTGIAGSIAPSKAAPYNIKDPTPTALNAAYLGTQIELTHAQTLKTDMERKAIEESLPYKVESARQVSKINSEKALQETTKTLELNESYQKRIEILSEQVKQSKSNSATKELDATLSNAGVRINDWIGWRKLSQIWEWATGESADKWVKENIPNNTDLINQAKEYFNRKKTNL